MREAFAHAGQQRQGAVAGHIASKVCRRIRPCSHATYSIPTLTLPYSDPILSLYELYPDPILTLP